MKLNKRTLDRLCDFFLNRIENMLADEAEMILNEILAADVDNYTFVSPNLIEAYWKTAKTAPTLYLRLMRPELGDKTLRNWLKTSINDFSI
jgi:hypothetical protein